MQSAHRYWVVEWTDDLGNVLTQHYSLRAPALEFLERIRARGFIVTIRWHEEGK